MAKRRLSLEHLEVESFTTAEFQGQRGTVEAQQASAPYVCETDDFCGCNDGISNVSCRDTCAAESCGTSGPSAGYTCPPNNTCNGPATCDIENTCGGCTAYTIQC